jgi:hypothetical protein
MSPFNTTEQLIRGRRYTAITTGKLNGKRVFREVTFVAAVTGEPEAFGRGSASTPDQDRVFVQRGSSSYPALFVTGSIREAIVPAAVSA